MVEIMSVEEEISRNRSNGAIKIKKNNEEFTLSDVSDETSVLIPMSSKYAVRLNFNCIYLNYKYNLEIDEEDDVLLIEIEKHKDEKIIKCDGIKIPLHSKVNISGLVIEFIPTPNIKEVSHQ